MTKKKNVLNLSKKDIKNIQKYSKKSWNLFSKLPLIWKFLAAVLIIIILGLLFNLSNPSVINSFLFEELQTTTENTAEKTTDCEGDKSYQVDRVVDGDTIKISDENAQCTARLIGVNTPETKHPRIGKECFGDEASEFAKNTLEGRRVRIEYDDSQDKKDRYNRILVYVYLEERNFFFNKELIKQGFAKEATYNGKYQFQSEFREAQAQAKTNNLGFWNSATCGGDFSADF